MPGTVTLILSGHEVHTLPYSLPCHRREIINKWSKQYDFDKIPAEVIIRPSQHIFLSVDEEACKHIRQLYATGEWTIVELGHRFAVSQTTINRVLKRNN